MTNKSDSLARFHKLIRTKHVFIEDDQVFMKRGTVDMPANDNHGEDWYPINLQWITVKL